MRRLRRAATVLVLVVVAGGSLVACGDKDEFEKDVLGFIDRTTGTAMRFAYLDQDLAGTKSEVTGLVEDDFRYKARFALDGEPVWDEVVSDDAVADLFIDPPKVFEHLFKVLFRDAAARGVNPAAGAGARAGGSTQGPEEATGARATAGTNPFADPAFTPDLQTMAANAPPELLPQLKALFERRWVLDPTGAPSLAVAVNDPRVPGIDPFFDALTTLDYVRKAVDASESVRRYDPNSLEPTYKPEEDPFPKPPEGSDVHRYDLKEPPLPTNQASSQGAVRQIRPPTAVHFRKMAIYVKDGRVVEVREEIDVQRKLKDFARNYDVDFPPGQSAEAQVRLAVDKINELGRSASSPPLRVRQMTLQLRDFGDDSIEVELPTENVVTGSLYQVIANRGRAPARTAGGPAGGAGAGPGTGAAGGDAPTTTTG